MLLKLSCCKTGSSIKTAYLQKRPKQIQNISFSNETLQEHSIKIKEKFIEVMLQKGN
jgi:hypothetical protein